MIRPIDTNKFKILREEGGEGDVRGGAEEKEEKEHKVKIDLKVSTKL
jgi:hypothetical protein